MKIRNGFVSNSSSSSFVVDGKMHTVRDIAIKMIPFREYTDDEHLIERLRGLRCCPDLPMKLDSLNYDTFILKRRNHIFVQTCKNHPFSSCLDNIICHLTKKEVEDILSIDSKHISSRNNNGKYQYYHFGFSEYFPVKFYNIDELEKLDSTKYDLSILKRTLVNIFGEKEYNRQMQTLSMIDILKNAAVFLFRDGRVMDDEARIIYFLLNEYDMDKIVKNNIFHENF